MKLKNIFRKIIFLIGIFFIIFPISTKYISNLNQTKIINNYNNNIAHMPNSEIERIKENAKDYNSQLYENNLFDSSLTQENISSIDFFGADILSYIIIPKINIELPIYEGSSDDVLSLGIGHLSNTSLPIGGINTHCVLVRTYWPF